jgi:hypothetical protein
VLEVSCDRFKWRFSRRFSEFAELISELKKAYEGTMSFPAPPPKTCSRSVKDEFLERRRAGLEAYLTELLASERALATDTLVRSFLSIPGAWRGRGTSGRPDALPPASTTSPASRRPVTYPSFSARVRAAGGREAFWWRGCRQCGRRRQAGRPACASEMISLRQHSARFSVLRLMAG